MAVASASPERIDLSQPMDPSPSNCASDAASESSSSPAISNAGDTPDPNDQSNSSQYPNRDVESPVALRSEEYRQLFRLPPEEVLVQDFNCAFQESILFQGHMYLFVRYICFYSNIFGFETKKIIPFNEITSVKRAKTAGIFPNAIEIFAGGRKYFFASFLSRDEAFKIINDGWLQHGNDAKAIAEHGISSDSISESGGQENGLGTIEKVNELDSVERDKDVPIPNDSMSLPNVENVESTTLADLQDNVEQNAESVVNTETSSSANTWTWKLENSDAPKISENYTRVAETKFPIKVEEFFSLFFSDSAVNFIESFHTRCGDKEFRCTSWIPHEKFGQVRDVSFQHPIKIYFGAKFGSCQEVQKFRVYRSSNLVIETSQEINDVPYGDYFQVEGLWDVNRDGDESKESCFLRVYVNVAFTKKTVWKGKIVQSTLEECREAYALWINMAHELLKQKNLENQEEVGAASMIQNGEVHSERKVVTGEPSERSCDLSDQSRIQQISDSEVNRVGNLVQGNFIKTTSMASLLRESATKFCSFLQSHGRISLILVIAFAVIFLMQFSILVLLNRPQHIHVASPAGYMGGMGGGIDDREAVAWLEKRMHHLKDEMLMVEAWLERMRVEHSVLKAQLNNLELLFRKSR